MDNFRVLRELENLAEKAIDVLNHSREIRSRSEAGVLRKSLQKILDEKEEKLEEILMNELASVLGEVAEFLRDPERSFKSKDFKKLRDEISKFLEGIGMKNNSE
jgi:molecular chaperone DnaK (HSP70)